MSRQGIIDAMKTHVLQQHHDIVEGLGVQNNAPVLANYSDDEPCENRDHGMFGTGTEFLDPRYCRMDKLTFTPNPTNLAI